MQLRIDELASRAGVTSRTIRDYQARGLLPAPRLEGRTGWYDREHLDRLMVIADLQERGFSLAAIKATLDAWADGHDLQGLLDFRHVLDAPWGDPEHQATTMPLLELAQRFSFLENLPEAINKAIASGLLEQRGEEFLAPAPVIIESAEYLLRLGMNLDQLLDLLAQTQDDVDRIAKRFVEFVAPPVIKRLQHDGVTEALDDVRKLRPFALGAVRAVLDASLRAAIAERLRQLGLELDAAMTGLTPAADADPTG